MKIKHIIAVAAALAAGSSFAAAINTTGGSGLFLVVTDTVNNKSYDLDLATTFASFTAANSATTGVNQTWTLSSDANWTSFFNAANSANYEWLVVGSKTGTVSVAGATHILTTVNSNTSLSGITAAAASSINATAGNISLVASDINSQAATAGGAASVVVTSGPAYITATSSPLTWSYNGKVSSDFLAYNDFGATSKFLDLSNTGTKSGGVYTESIYQGTFQLTAGALTFTAAAVPESSTFAMVLAGLGIVGAVARRRAV